MPLPSAKFNRNQTVDFQRWVRIALGISVEKSQNRLGRRSKIIRGIIDENFEPLERVGGVRNLLWPAQKLRCFISRGSVSQPAITKQRIALGGLESQYIRPRRETSSIGN